MNFKGRYFTYGGTVVAVHRNDKGELWGHVIRTKAPYKDDRIFYWNENAECLGVMENGLPTDCLEYLEDLRVGNYSLKERVNPQGLEDSIECVDCKDCREERKGKINHVTNS